jgi:DNA-binding MarR family transcriptional regulator
MSIDQEIHQDKWSSFTQKAVVNTLFTSRVLEDRTAARLKPFGLTGQQFNILRILRGQKGKPATVKLLTERMLDKSSNASRLVDKLLEKGLVERVTCPDDRRAVDVLITPTGDELLARIDRDGGLEEPFRSFSESDARTLSDLLDRLRDAVRSAEETRRTN